MKRSPRWLLPAFLATLCFGLTGILVAVAVFAPRRLPLVTPVVSPDSGDVQEPGEATPAPGGESMEIGETVEGSLQAGTHDEWTFTANANDTVTIWMMSDAFDAYLELNDPSGESLAYDNDSASALTSDAVIRDVRLPMEGTYTISAYSIDRSSGPYTLCLRASVPGASGGMITPGKTVEGYLEIAEQEAWTFNAQAGDEFVISLDRSDVYATLELLAPGGGVLVGDYMDTPTSYVPLNADTSGTYTIRIRSHNGRSTGPYSLTLEEQIR
jgi:hypothetical protein